MAVLYPRKLISLFYKDYFGKQIAISKTIVIVSVIVRLIIKPAVKTTALKQKQGQLATNSTNK